MSRHGVHLSPQAERDLNEAFRYLAREGGLSVAVRFDQAVEEALERLAEMPGIGASIYHNAPMLTGVRRWGVPGFRRYLLFYREVPDGIEVTRMLHGARDLDRVLSEDDDRPDQDE